MFDMDYFGGDDALGDVEVDVKELFSAEEAVNFGRKVTRVSHEADPFLSSPKRPSD